MSRTPGRRRALLFAALVQTVVALAALVVLSGDGDGGGPSSPRRSGPTLSEGAQLSGQVIDAATREPIRGAVVRIDHAGGVVTVQTSATGSYRAVVDPSRPVGLTVDTPGYLGAVAFAKLCAGERRTLSFSLTPAGSGGTPPAPVVLAERCG